MAKRNESDLAAIGKQVINRYDEGVSYASSFRQRIDLLAPYIEPTRANVQAPQAPGAALMARMYDSEGISSADLAVRQMGSYLHGPGAQWFGLEDENDDINTSTRSASITRSAATWY